MLELHQTTLRRLTEGESSNNVLFTLPRRNVVYCQWV
jgi:hypothetical protein